MNHTEFSLRRPVTITMIFAALALVGAISARLLPLEEFPDIQFPGFFVLIPYDGSTPEEIELQITRPAEEALATLPGVKNMYSTSREDQAEIWLEYGFDSNAQTEAVEARVKLDSIRDQLPDDLQRIQVFSGSLSDQPIMQLRVSSDRDLSTEYELLDRLVKRRIERVEGVSQVRLEGVEPPEISILLDAGRIAAHNVNLQELASLLQRSNFAVSAGQLTSGERRWSLRPRGEYQSLEDVRDLIIDDGNLRLGDIARVSRAPRERNYGRHLDGNYAIGISVSRATGANMVEVSDRVKEEIEAIGKLPQMRGIKIFDLQNQAESVRQSLRDLAYSGAIGSVLAIIVLYLFLRQLSTTLIVTLTVPLSLLITLGALYFFGLTLNVLTLMGMMIAIGMLVDNSVVITESIFRYRQKMPDQPVEATLAGVKEVGIAVIASTATSVCVFLPLIFDGGVDIMVFLRHVGITISFAIVCSLIIAQTLIPVLASRIKTPPISAKEDRITRVKDRYSRGLAWLIDRPWRSALIAILILVSPAVPIATGMFKNDPFPEEPTRRLFLRYHLNDYYSLERVEAAVSRIEGFIFENAERLDVRSVYSYWETGRAETTILLTQGDAETIDSRKVMDIILEEKPDIAIGDPSFERRQTGGGEGFSVNLVGESTDRLIPITREAIRLLRTVDGLEDVATDLTAGSREVQVRVDRERAAQLGLTSEEVAQAVMIALRGENLREFRSPDGEIDMRIAFRDSDRQSAEQLGDLRIPKVGPDGEIRSISLRSIATILEQPGMRNIRRTNRRTSINVSAALADGETMDSIRPKVSVVLDQLALPPGYEWTFGRGFERNDETQNILGQNIMLGILFIFIVMAALFESLLYPLSIMVSLIYSIVGVIWFLSLTGTTMTFMAMIGIMVLIGVVVNNGIVLVDHINNLRREGMVRRDAIMQGARDRLRPILMTVATTVLGLAPLAFGTTQVGADGPPYYPMARAIIGGLLFSTVVSLFMVPLTYIALDNLKNWVQRVKRHATLASGRAARARQS